MPESRRTTGNKTSFAPGKSGNPGGRPKQTQEQKDALEAIRKLSLKTPVVLEQILENGKDSDRLKAVEIILDRTFGKADSCIKHEIDDKTNGVLSEIIEAVNRV